ncbi:methyltransferase family protein [Oerskovia flava]|uniref:methyltransferase family protein n=1 Tax=Oerskovia flava TaxID=2986422 RepID=UPI002240216B|nr:isoprenylcysteine carboxylmethyltransferase family protein [Oerskovia sp. JB1-3-2]
MDRHDLLVVAQGAAAAGVLWPGRDRWDVPSVVTGAARGLVVAGLALVAAGAAPHGTSLTPRVAPPRSAHLLTDGVYARTRHPIYTGLVAAALGTAVLRRRARPLVAAAGLVAVLDAKVRAEEGALAERFGDEYRDYAARTPRWLPRVRAARP